MPNDIQPGGGRSVWRGVARLAISLAFSAAVLAGVWVYKRIDARGLLAQWGRTDKPLLAAVVLLSAAFHVFVGAHKLWCILRAMGVNVSYREVLGVRLGAGPLRGFIPQVGELVNIVYFWRRKRMPFGRASGASVFDKFLNSLGAAIWLLVGVALAWPAEWATHWRPAGLGIPVRPAIFGGVIALLLVFFLTPAYALLAHLAGRAHPRFGRLAAGVVAPFRELSWGNKLFFTAYGVFFQFRYLLVCYYLFRAFRISPAPDFADVMLRGSVVVFAAHLGGFAGMGPRELIVVTLFSAYASADALLGVGLMLSFSISLAPMLAGVPWTVWFLRRLKAAPGPDAAPRPAPAGIPPKKA